MATGSVQPFLTREGTLVFTLTSNGYKLLTWNLVTMLRGLRVPWKLCVVCADAASYRFFRQEGVPCLQLRMTLPEYGPNVVPFGTRQFQALNRKKLELLAWVAGQPEVRQAIYIDGDIAVYADFVEDIETRLAAAGAPQILFQCDEQTRLDCSGGAVCPNRCTGCFAWRAPLDPATFQIQGAELERVWRDRPEDQPFVGHMVQLFGLQVGTLPRNLYPNGMYASLFGRDSPLKRGAKLLHYNWMVGGMKQKRMAANGDWLLPY
jgi:hypothetical protein